MKNIKKRMGQMPILTIVLGGVFTIAMALGGFVIDSLSSRVMVIESHQISSLSDISSIKTDISWIKESLQARGFQPDQYRKASSTTLK